MAEREPSADEGLGDLFGRLVDDGKGYAQAEIGYYRTLVRSKLRDARASLWMGAAALGLAQAAAVALVVGSVLTLAPRVGPGWATLIVVVTALALAGVMGWFAWQHVKRVIGQEP